eukprot:5803456-Alexandrium_andersonii.AAC.1
MRFASQRGLGVHVARMHPTQQVITAAVRCNFCPLCRSTFTDAKTARRHVRQSLLLGGCAVDQCLRLHPLRAPLTWD